MRTVSVQELLQIFETQQVGEGMCWVCPARSMMQRCWLGIQPCCVELSSWMVPGQESPSAATATASSTISMLGVGKVTPSCSCASTLAVQEELKEEPGDRAPVPSVRVVPAMHSMGPCHPNSLCLVEEVCLAREAAARSCRVLMRGFGSVLPQRQVEYWRRKLTTVPKVFYLLSNCAPA